MVRHALKYIFQKPTPNIDSSDRTQQLRSKTVYAATVNLAQHLVEGNSNLNKTYTGPYEIVTQAGNSKMIASRSYSDLLSITKGKVLLNQLPLNSHTQAYYQKNFARGQMYQGNYNQFDPSFNFNNSCNDSVMVYDIGTTGFTGPASYDANGGFIGATGPQNQESVSYTGYVGTMVASESEQNNTRIFIDPNHCYYSDPCLLDASYTRFVSPVLSGLTGSGPFTAQQIINADQYRGFSYPMPNFSLTCTQPILNQEVGPLFCPLDGPPVPPIPPLIIAVGSRGENAKSTIAISQDGITWSGLGATIFTENGYDVAWNGSNLWVAVGNGTNTIATSINGTDWIPRSSVNSIFNTGFGVAYGSNLWVAVGNGTMNSIATSPNGIIWTGLGNSIFTGSGNAGVAWNGFNLWVAVGEGTNTIATSPNGTAWTGLGNTILNQGAGVAYGSNLWIAVGGGGGNKIVTSSNGTIWTPSSSGNSLFTLACLDVAWNGSNLWVAVGNGTNTIATSINGTDWIPSTNGNSIFSIGHGVTWNTSLQLWIAVGGGTNTVATSTNGTDWIPRSTVNTIFSVGLGVTSN
jgi:hypothetical protein